MTLPHHGERRLPRRSVSCAAIPVHRRATMAYLVLGRIAVALLLDTLDRGLDAGEVRVDGERRLEGPDRRFLAVEREIDLAETGEGAEMMRLERQRTLDVADAGVEIVDQEIGRCAPVPALGEILAEADHVVAHGECLIGIVLLDC